MNNNKFQRKPLARLIAFALAATTVVGIAQAAAPLAGTEIKNLATVTYEDENGNTYTAQSNEAIITVAEQYRATLENDRTQSAAPGQTVYFPHTLTNTGNTPDTYTLEADNGAIIYLDTNGNGQPDAGEDIVTDVTLAAGETANLVVAYAIPTTAATDGSDDTTVVLTATSGNAAGVVEDTGTNADSDALDNNATNTDIVNITSGPVLVLNKESVFDAANNRVTYTLTVKNTGDSDAKLVDIIDAVPMVDTDGAGTMQPLTNVTIVSVNGLLTSNGDTVPAIGAATLVQMDETLLDTDLNGDGDKLDASVDVIKATDAVIEADTTVSIVYSADYDPAWHAGESIDNTFVTSHDNDENGTPETTTPSNTTHDVIPQTYAVTAEDDAVAPDVGSPGVNDGLDDDTIDNNDVQVVDVISSGDTVIFTHTVTNDGNGDDIFNLDVANTDFPAGTVFTLWNASGTVQLTDSDSDSTPDTGVLGQNETVTIVVKANLPAGEAGAPATGYNAILTATSSADNTVSDPTNLTLGKITAPAVDLAAVTDASVDHDGTAVTVTNNAVQDAAGFNDGGAAANANAHDEDPVLFANDAPIGSTVAFPMAIANESGSADSFLLTHANLPTGWSVIFKDDAGNTITSTPFLPAGKTFNYTAHVTISSNPAEAQGDSPRATDTDGNDEVDDGKTVLVNNDGDRDYVIEFIVSSAADSTKQDSIYHAVDVKSVSVVSITPDGQNQIQPGGTVDYPHKLSNDGNVAEVIEITSSNSEGTWNSRTLIDTDGNGTGDTELANLTKGTVIKVYNPDGSTPDVTLIDGDGDGVIEFPLEPGQYVKLVNKVFAPADAPQGDVNTTTLTAQNVDDTPRNTATDTTDVILGQVRLDKTVALQTDCTDPTTIGTFAAIQSANVEPGQCAVWQIVAKNEGGAVVKNVIVTDNIPAYTASLAGSLQYCKGFGCAPAAVTDLANDDAGEVDGDVVTFYVGDSPVFGTTGGELLSGESATVRFTVKIDE